jgi:hypothetical protein
VATVYAAKAWVAGVIAFLTALLAEWTDANDPLQPRDIFVALLAFCIAGGAVYGTPNGRRVQ